MGQVVNKFSPRLMSDELILALSTGRENLQKKITVEMANCLKSGANQHFLIYGPRGMGKSFFIRLLEIKHNSDNQFENSIFISFPEEQDNMEFVADIMDMISVKLEGGEFQSVFSRWDISENEWQRSKKRLRKALDTCNVNHVFFCMENLQDFIPRLDDTENGRLREFLEEMVEISMIGSSTRPDMDNDYTKKLFQVFKKILLPPWTENDFLAYVKKLAIHHKKNECLQQENLEQKIKAISKFSGGSPRIAMILSEMIINNKVTKPINLLNGIVDELTPYYQDLTRAIPKKTKKLFDALIRGGENMTQTELAQFVDKSQNFIARSFVWLLDNFYVVAIKQKRTNTKHYFIQDRIYVLYYQSRQIYSDHPFSFIKAMTEFLKEFYRSEVLRKKVKELLNNEKEEGRFLASMLLEDAGKEFHSAWPYDKLLNQLDEIDNDEIFQSFIHKFNKKKYEEIIDIAPNYSQFKKIDVFLNLLGVAYAKLGEMKEAIKKYQKAIDLNPNFVVAYLNFGSAMQEQGNFTEAIKQFQKAIKINPQIADSYYNLGNAMQEIGNFDEAIKQYQKAIDLNSKFTGAYFNLGLIMFKIGDFDEAIKQYQKAIDLNPNLANTYNNIGLVLKEKGSLDEAIKYHQKAIDLNPKLTAAYSNLGVALKAKGDIDEAIKHHRKAIDLDPQFVDAYSNLGVALMAKGNLDEAIKQLKKAISLNPKLAVPYSNLGVALMAKGNLDEALIQYQKALELNPTLISTNANILIIYLKQKDENSINTFLHSLAVDQINEIVFRVLENILTRNRSEDFHTIISMMERIKNIDHKKVDNLFVRITTHLYKIDEITMLSDIVSEFERKQDISDAVKMYLEVWNYILDPTHKDIASIHPDIRVTIEAILAEKRPV